MKVDVSDLKNNATGKWFGILQSFGIETRHDDKHGPCPICGGKDRFRTVDNGAGFICNQCGAGDSISLIQRVTGLDFINTIKQIADILGEIPESENKTENKLTEQVIKKMLNDLWQSSTPVTGSDLVSQYLHGRHLSLTPENVRYSPSCYESETKIHYPAMVAKVVGPTGTPVTIHRTYLDGAKKASIKSPKKTMPCIGSMRGAAIRLFAPKDGTIGVAEGIETAIAATQLYTIPTWSTLNSSIMMSFEPPEGVRKIVIFADNDANFTGAKAAYTLANRLYLKDYIVSVEVPPNFNDWADELKHVAEKNQKEYIQ